ncbi:MAG: hydrogenase small subunit, partial [Syntrophomonadaceae bacterium]|nr:hydrogenase small subunit [Syntrophomonadaceae bacterium]
TVGERDGKPITFTSMLAELASQAAAVLNFGTCSCFGGIPAADPNPTGCVSVPEFLKGKNITMINVPGCPPHPDWMVGTIAQVLLYGLPEVDTFGRPTMFFGRMIHDNCERRQYFDNGIFAEKFGDPGCMLQLGCKGPLAYCDASTRGWNNGVNWCVRCGGTCVGCTDPEFPNWTMYERMSELAAWPTISASADTIGLVLGAATALGIGGHLAGNVFAGRFKGKPHEEE